MDFIYFGLCVWGLYDYSTDFALAILGTLLTANSESIYSRNVNYMGCVYLNNPFSWLLLGSNLIKHIDRYFT